MEKLKSQPGIVTVNKETYQIAKFKNEMLYYDFAEIIYFLIAKGKSLFGEHFKIYKIDLPLLHKLICYRIADPGYCKKYNIDTNKGLLLTGPIGCGKTSIITLLKHITPHLPSYQVIPARNVTFSFNFLGYKVIQNYGDSSHYCFDDIGVEPTGKHFGKECNVIGEILLSRYEMYLKANKLKSRGLQLKTHATTNLNADELEEKYGNRVRSRMREMFNLISFEADSQDKRG